MAQSSSEVPPAPETHMSPAQDQPRPRVLYSADVEAYYERFRDKYSRDRYKIQNRWLNMTKSVRRQVLDREWRNTDDGPSKQSMPQKHRPDLEELVPWRGAAPSARNLFPLKKNLNEKHVRWPSFNLQDLANRRETLLVLLDARADDHPKEFAEIDDFSVNRAIAKSEGYIEQSRKEYQFEPGDTLVVVTGAGEGENDYGAIYEPGDQEEADYILQDHTVWPRAISEQLMRNQRRIYAFLEQLVTCILGREQSRVDNEEEETDWVPELPDLDGEDFETELDDFIQYGHDTINYTSINANPANYFQHICRKWIDRYETRLQALKSSPHSFYQLICDVRDHTSHEMIYLPSGRKHAWANFEDNINNPDMFADYLLNGLYHITDGYDAWLDIAIITSSSLFPNLPQSADFTAGLIYVHQLLESRIRYLQLFNTLLCSKPMRRYGLNYGEPHASTDMDSQLVVNPRFLMSGVVSPARRLAILLGTMSEDQASEYFPTHDGMWIDETWALITGSPGGAWMSNYAIQFAEESYDATRALQTVERLFSMAGVDPAEYRHLGAQGWDSYTVQSKKLREDEALKAAVKSIVSKHMVPRPDQKFDYPNSTSRTMKLPKIRMNARTRIKSESNLAALWGDLQALLVEREALSEDSIESLNTVIPLATAEDGSDITPTVDPGQIPPPPPDRPATPQSSGPGGSAAGVPSSSTAPDVPTPSTPPGAPGPSNVQTTPTGPLEGLTIQSQDRRPPAVRTPERKTADDGVKKHSPIRAARPDEDGPRRFQATSINRRKRREERVAHAAERANIIVPAPAAAPAPGREYPQIVLTSDSYNTLKDIMTSDGGGRTGTVPWNDIGKIFSEIGFNSDRRGSRGAVIVFEPTDELREAQGINKPISKDRPHDGNMSMWTARKWLRGQHGFGKYGWGFEKFKEAST